MPWKDQEKMRGIPKLKERIYYRGDKEIFRKAKSRAALEGKPVGDFIDEAIKEKLNVDWAQLVLQTWLQKYENQRGK
jgi:hypothetical protein